MKALGSFVFPSSRLFTNTADVILRGPELSPRRPPEAHFNSDGWIRDGVMRFILRQAIKHWCKQTKSRDARHCRLQRSRWPACDCRTSKPRLWEEKKCVYWVTGWVRPDSLLDLQVAFEQSKPHSVPAPETIQTAGTGYAVCCWLICEAALSS